MPTVLKYPARQGPTEQFKGSQQLTGLSPCLLLVFARFCFLLHDQIIQLVAAAVIPSKGRTRPSKERNGTGTEDVVEK